MVTISGSLISDVRTALDLSLQYDLTGKGTRHGVNAYTPHAFSAYVSAVASIEAFVNEIFLGSDICLNIYQTSSLWDLDRDALEKMDLLAKLIIMPKLLFGISFSRDKQPFQNFSLLVKVRNDIVHYKMKSGVPKYLADLAQRGFAISSGDSSADYPWPWRLSCSEGIRWAHNTACSLAQGLVNFVPDEHKDVLAPHAGNYLEIPDDRVRQWFTEHGLTIE